MLQCRPVKKSKLGFELHAADVDIAAPLLYLIETTDAETGEIKVIYVGCSKRGYGRPFTAYDNNIRRMLAGRPPRNGKEFREIHHALLDAHLAGQHIRIRLVKNVPAETILDDERALQALYGLSCA